MEQNNKSVTTSTSEFKFEQLDLAGILKASLAISEQLLPEKISEILMQIIMQESGADKGYLLLERDNQLSIVSEGNLNNEINVETYNALKVPDYNLLPESILQYVKSTNEKVVIDDVSTDKLYHSDKYILKTKAKSIACLPISKEKKSIGIIYLENNSSTGVFTPEKIVVLKILSAQAKSSFENAMSFNSLNRSKKRFQDIMDNSTAVVFAKYLNGKYLFINKEFEKLYKVDREKVINLSDFDIFPKEFAESFIEKDKLILETEKPSTYEEQIPHDDGMHTYIVAKFPLRDSDGKFYAIGGIATDISNLKRMQESLRENQNRFNFVLAATQDSIYDWDLISGRIWRNEQYEKLFDGPSGPNFTWWKHNIHPDEFVDVSARLELAFSKHDQLWNQEYRFKRSKEGYSYVIDRAFIIYDGQGKAVRMIGALMDITERKESMDAMRISEERLKEAQRIAHVGNWDLDLLTNKLVWSDEILRIFEIKKEDFTESYDTFLNAIHPKDRDRVDAAYKHSLETHEPYEIIHRLLMPDGRIKIVQEQCETIYNKEGKVLRSIGTIQDITERKLTEEAEKKRATKIIERQSELLKLNNLAVNIPLKEKLKKVIEADAKTMNVERVNIQFFDADRISITSENTYILSKSDYGPGVSIMKKDFPRYFSELEFNTIIDANNAESDPRTSELTEKYLKQFSITSLLSVPFRLKGKIIGFISHEHVGPKRNWTYEEMIFVNSISDIISLLLESNEREKTENELKKLNELLEERVKARTAELSSSEEKFRAVVETAIDAIISFDKDWKIISWNKAAEKMFGYGSTEAIGQPITIIIPQYYIENLKKSFANYLKTNEATIIGKGIVEMNGLKKSGEEFPGELSIEAWKSNNEDFFTGIIRNITERKNYEAKLKEYQHFFNLSNELLCVANVKGYFEIVNSSFMKILGYAEKDILENKIASFVHPDDVVKTEQELLKLATGLTSIDFVNRYRKRDGSYLTILWNASPDASTGKIYAIGREYTEVKKVDEIKPDESKAG